LSSRGGNEIYENALLAIEKRQGGMLAGNAYVKLRAKSFDLKKISPWRNNLEVRYGRTAQLIAPINNNDGH
jgi:hypothetical protein